MPPGPTCQPAQPPGTVAMAHRSAPRAPLSVWHGAARARRPGAVAGRLEPPAAAPGPPLLPSPSSTRTPSPAQPLFLYLPPTAPFKRALPHPISPSLCSPFEVDHEHPSPSLSLSSAPVADLPQPLPYIKLLPLPFSPLMVNPTRVLLSPRTGGPSPPLSLPPTAGPHRCRLGTLTCHLGEPPLPPPCQACCHCPHGARTTFPGTPCLSASPGWPRHRGRAARGDHTVGGAQRARSHARRPFRPWAGLGCAGGPRTQHCCYGLNGHPVTVWRIFCFSIFLYNSKNRINF
jgi:hypothetical protein